ncbi:hypothetical protein EV194_101344 [Natronoflexus pectinivorans]|uniref:Uncharacterized protein n=1 Tax=Natronoflexus pectinivorans TaxID=682526 RepID=A0A4R2GN84_9BACT|nr:hypothetical protein EV194_101344 [Natronoflexus pectinivorans]
MELVPMLRDSIRFTEHIYIFAQGIFKFTAQVSPFIEKMIPRAAKF